MLSFKEFLEEKLVTFGGRAYPKFGQVVILAGGAGSGKGYAQDTQLGIDGMVFDVDKLKKLSLKSKKINDEVKKRLNIDLSKFDLKNPDDVGTVHQILADEMKTISKSEAARFTSILSADPRRKPNLIFDVTLKDMKKLDTISRNVRDLGYEIDNIHVVWVVNDFRVAMKQNLERDRVVPEDILLATHVGAGNTMKGLIEGTYDLRKYADGDFWLVFNKEGVDSTVATSGRGGSYNKDANSIKLKRQGDGIQRYMVPRVAEKIASYTPELSGWQSDN